jgi:hypothetical protein
MAIRKKVKQRVIRWDWWRFALAASGLGLVAAAVAQQLRRPRAERTWEGKVGGMVPYNLRPPTVQRLREAYWDRDDPRIVRPKAFGVGWDVNFGAMAPKEQLLQSAWDVDPNHEADLQRVVEDRLREYPEANFEEVLASWHVRRGVPIDDAEAAKVHQVYQRIKGGEPPLRVDRWLEAS